MSQVEKYRRLFEHGGRRVMLQRRQSNAQPVEVANVRARIRGFTPQEIAGGFNVGQRKILILAEDIPASLRPLRQNDRVIVDGTTWAFPERPDDQTHRAGDVLLAYDCVAAGV